jgi:hypothetical protein
VQISVANGHECTPQHRHNRASSTGILLCVYVCSHMYMHMCVYMHVCTYACMHLSACVLACMCVRGKEPDVCVHIYLGQSSRVTLRILCIHMSGCMPMFLHRSIHIRICTYIHTFLDRCVRSYIDIRRLLALPSNGIRPDRDI